jgi:hypothetical protein
MKKIQNVPPKHMSIISRYLEEKDEGSYGFKEGKRPSKEELKTIELYFCYEDGEIRLKPKE